MKLKWMLMDAAETTESAGSQSLSSSTPVETPSESEGSEEIIAGAEASPVNWDDLLGSDEESEGSSPSDTPGEQPVEEPAHAAAPSPAAVEATPAPAPAAPVAAAPAPTLATPQAQPVETPVAAPAAPVKTDEQLRLEAEEAVQRHETALTTHYALPEDLAAQLATEPEVVLPKLAAKVHMAVVNEVMARVNQVLPQTMAALTEHQRVEVEAKSRFYGRWPELQGYEQQVLAAGRMFRSMNPNATPDEALERVGEMVKAAMGLQSSAPTQGNQGNSGTQPARPAPRPAAPKQGFRPATPGGGGNAPAPVETNPFTQLASEWGDDS